MYFTVPKYFSNSSRIFSDLDFCRVGAGGCGVGCGSGEDCIIGAGALVTGGTVIPDGMLALGSPAKVIRPLTEEEKKHNQTNAIAYMMMKTVQ